MLYSFYFSIPSHSLTQHRATIQAAGKWFPQTYYHYELGIFFLFFFSVLKYPKLQPGFKQSFPSCAHHKGLPGVPIWFPVHQWLSEGTVSFVTPPGQECRFYIWSEMEVEMQKLRCKTSSCSQWHLKCARLDGLKEHFLSADPFWPRWVVLMPFPDVVNKSDNMQPMEICSNC